MGSFASFCFAMGFVTGYVVWDTIPGFIVTLWHHFRRGR